MSTLTKLALGAMGQLRPRPAKGDARPVIKLPAPDKRGGLPLMQALAKRRSSRKFARKPLPEILDAPPFALSLVALAILAVYMIANPLRNAGSPDEPAPPTAIM